MNPLPYAGAISVFLLAVVIVSGLYLTLFFEYGFDASYHAVAKMQGHPIQSVVRAVHRYASAGLVLTVVVHAWRIFTAKRFTGRKRRWRWASGVGALVLVWLAGVTGYWLVWDRRAAALNEVVIGLLGRTGVGATFLVDRLLGPRAGSGWTVLLAIWFAHLGLSAAITYATYRHVRRSRLGWLPPKHWMALMTGALLVMAIALPVDLLGPADPSALVADMPLDPFVLFLLPPLLTGAAWFVVLAVLAAIVAAAVLPRLLTRSDPPVVVIDEAACTGCDLCVTDCPYVALSLVPRTDPQAKRAIAVVDVNACVGCGICIGSCSFGAMTLPGSDAVQQVQPAGKRVVVACARHVTHRHGQRADDEVIVGVSCTGMFHSQAIASLMERGATAVQIVGCPPGDCSYGIGNTLTADRLEGLRAPHVTRQWAGVADEDFVPPGELAGAIAHPGAHPQASPEPDSYRALVSVGFVVLASLAVVAAATRAPFRPPTDVAGIRVVVDHEPGEQLLSEPAPSGEGGALVTVVISVDGRVIEREQLPQDGTRAVGVVDATIEPGTRTVKVALVETADVTAETVIYEGTPTFAAGRQLVVEASDLPPVPGVSEGMAVFNSRSGGACKVCHSVEPGGDGVGPSLAGIGTRGADRLPGLSAADYIRQSILSPDAYIVDGYRAGQMLDIYQDRLSPEELDALVAYLSSLTEGEG
ncbi:MAG: hydrogenase iron-sulfur subunit [Acidimicrobiales bacterium]